MLLIFFLYYIIEMPRKPYKQRTKKAAIRRYGKKANASASVLQSAIRRAITNNNNRMLETKTSIRTRDDGAEMFHNTIYVRESSLLGTTQGTADPNNANASNRIGDKITLSGLSVKVMFELNERYSMATFRIFVVKSAKGDVPTNGTLFNGVSGNKMIDTLNRERYSILASKTFTIRQSSLAMQASGIQEVGSGFTKGTTQLSNATKIVKLWVPANKLIRGKNLTYENGTNQPKFYDYHLVYYAYSNYQTNTTFYVGRINDEVIQLYYKDA